MDYVKNIRPLEEIVRAGLVDATVHTTAFTMDIYTHTIPAVEHEAAEQIADLVFGIYQAKAEASDGADGDRDTDAPPDLGG